MEHMLVLEITEGFRVLGILSFISCLPELSFPCIVCCASGLRQIQVGYDNLRQGPGGFGLGFRV